MAQSATDMIREDHRKVEQLYRRYQGSKEPAAAKQALAEQICHELEVHASIEEGIFYPAVQVKLGGDNAGLVDEALREHGELKKLIGQIRDGGEDSAGDGRMQALMQSVAHHVHEEERQMLPQAEQRLGAELERVGAQMQQRKQETLPPTAAAE
jgi:hemerythrin-like domain-containing protein